MMIDLNTNNYRQNAELLLRGIWYAELPDLLDIDEMVSALDSIFAKINLQSIQSYKQEEDNFISDWKNIVSPKHIRSPGVEAACFFEFKKNKSLREMQIPHLLHYISFMYNTLLEFSTLFEQLYINPTNAQYIKNSNSYLVFEEGFLLHTYDDEEDWAVAGTFITKNNKINSSSILEENKRRMLAAEADYLYSLKLDIESFFPNLYTHNFEKMALKSPFIHIGVDARYFHFLDQFHQRINNNQTKGIPAGTFSSHVAAELCMLAVDEEIRSFLASRPERIGYIRYVDDLTFFSDSESELTALYPAVQSILNQYRLRINGNKTETIHSVYATQPSYVLELEQEFPTLKTIDDPSEWQLSDLFMFKKYVSNCLYERRTSQLRALLGLLLRKIESEKLKINVILEELFFYLFKLVFEENTLTGYIYRLLDVLLMTSTNKEALINALQSKQKKIDAEYPDTLLQIWHYYVLFKHSSETQKNVLIDYFSTHRCNPLVATALVRSGKETNKKLFRLIRDQYIQESGSSQWQAEIMYSKWWLPLFKIARYDPHDYDHFMKSSNFPELLKLFPLHAE